MPCISLFHIFSKTIMASAKAIGSKKHCMRMWRLNASIGCVISRFFLGEIL